jgi:hypothetical protein
MQAPVESEAGDAVEIWTDGGCKPNPGPGGWGAVLRFRGHERELSGAEPATTNNRMELIAATSALEALKRPCIVTLHTDSEYVKNGITRWHTGWVRRCEDLYQRPMVLTGFDRHCEERSDAAIQGGRAGAAASGLLRFARNDEPKRVRR